AAVADNWDEHGTPIVTKPPEKPKKEEAAASAAPASEANPEPKGKREAESGSAKREPKQPGEKLSADERISQLVADRNIYKQRADELDRRLRELESKTAPAPKAEAKPKEPPKRPNPFTWTGTQEEFDKAMDEYEEYRDSLTAARTRQEQAQSEAQKAMGEMLKQATAKHPDATEKIKSATSEIMTKAPAFIQGFVNDSEVLGELLYTLADQETLSKLLETAKGNPGKALRVLRDMELDIQKALSEPKEKVPETKPRAPKPPSEVGGRGAATEDPAVSAAKDGNFSAFDAEQRRRYMRAAS